MTGIAESLTGRKPAGRRWRRARSPRNEGDGVYRTWYRRQSDGTFFRNCPLITAERERATDPSASARLRDEWVECFREGVITAGEIEPGDQWIDYDDSPEATARWVEQVLERES